MYYISDLVLINCLHQFMMSMTSLILQTASRNRESIYFHFDQDNNEI
jgi:hypothetical protein